MTAPGSRGVCVLGAFAADVGFRADRLPRLGETLLGRSFQLGPGGKGSNQAVAAARAGARTAMIGRIGDDPFGAMARRIWRDAGIDDAYVAVSPQQPTGAAFIFIDDASGDNAIIIARGAAGEIGPAEVAEAGAAITGAAVFLTQLEISPAAALEGLRLARRSGVLTILNPAPALPLDASIYPLCDFITPNETEVVTLTGVPVEDLAGARSAGDVLLRRGIGCVLITLGERGVLFHGRQRSELVPSYVLGPVVDTTGAGDAFNGGFAAALAEGVDPFEAARFGCATAALSVTRLGAAASMPYRAEIDRVFMGDGMTDLG